MSTHLLSLPAETLDSITTYLPHPIDALNLSFTCRYFYEHLSTEHNNKFWYYMLINSQSAFKNYQSMVPLFGDPPVYIRTSEYSPTENYKSWILKSLREFGCQFCLGTMRSSNYRSGDRGECRVYGFKICMGCLKKHTISISKFSSLGLDITTNPPKFTDVEIFNVKIRRKINMRFYWKFDIESLCIAQFGMSLVHLQRRKEEQKLAKAISRKENPSWLRKLRDQTKSNIAESVWTIFTTGPAFDFARRTYAANVSRDELLAWLHLRQEDDIVKASSGAGGILYRHLMTVRSKSTFAEKDGAWCESVAHELLACTMEESPGSTMMLLAEGWHTERLSNLLAAPTHADQTVYSECPFGSEIPTNDYEIGLLINHVMKDHPEIFWARDDWTGW